MIVLLLLAPIVILSVGFGAAAFLDSERQVVGRAVSPDGTWTAQLERLTVGGAPNMVVTLRRSWHPDRYLTSCKPVSYYGESAAVLRWRSNGVLLVDAATDPGRWNSDPPFRWTWPWSGSEGCDVTVEVR
jgi:hypothetical protein